MWLPNRKGWVWRWWYSDEHSCLSKKVELYKEKPHWVNFFKRKEEGWFILKVTFCRIISFQIEDQIEFKDKTYRFPFYGWENVFIRYWCSFGVLKRESFTFLLYKCRKKRTVSFMDIILENIATYTTWFLIF